MADTPMDPGQRRELTEGWEAKIARAVERQARQQLPARKLPKAAAFPTTYRIAYRLLGFGGAEWLAKTARQPLKASTSDQSA